jgi:hypothetical protein
VTARRDKLMLRVVAILLGCTRHALKLPMTEFRFVNVAAQRTL